MTENNLTKNFENNSVDDSNLRITTESTLMSDFFNLMRDPNNLETATSYLYHSLIDEAILGVVFEVHHSIKSGTVNAVEGQPEDEKPYSIVDLPDFDVFGPSTAKKQMECNCPICYRLVAAFRFAPHLEKCMGMGRNSSRIASRRLANTRDSSESYFGSNMSDDEDDADWSGEKRKKKMQTPQRNGSKKNGKSS